MDGSTAAIRAENLTLTQQNLSLRKQITSLRNDRLQLQYKLVETIGAKESFKIEVIKLITQAQNTFERLKTFIEHTTSTPPPPMLSGTEKLLRRQIVGNNQLQQQQSQLHYTIQPRQQQQQQQQQQQAQQQQQHGILRQIPTIKDALQQIPEVGIVPPPPNTPNQEQQQHDDMHSIDKKIRKLNTILRTYKRDIQKDMEKDLQKDLQKDPQKHDDDDSPPAPEQAQPSVMVVVEKNNEIEAKQHEVNQESRRYSKRLQTNNRLFNNKENHNITCPLMDITNEPSDIADDLNATITPKSRGRKRKILL